MPFHFTTRKVNDVVIYDLYGKLTAGEPVKKLAESLRSQVADGNHHVVLNLRNLLYADSSGLCELVSQLSHIRARGGDIKLILPPTNE